ncbi:kinase-like domain-containing protein [Irpex lacteus]|nr:kinase-like domain-containing protein [Irpex lacteus]
MTRRLLAAYDVLGEVDGKPQITGYWIAWEEDGRQYKTEYKGRTFDLEKLDAPEPILPEHLTTPWVESYLEAPKPLPSNTFIKSNAAIRYEPSEPTLLSELMRKEIGIYMKLARSPHPNICTFYGCVREGQQVTALALKQIPLELPYIWKDAGIMVPKLNLLRGLKRGLDHLHSLGIIHNDINSNNVRLDECFQPVIIDFNTALPEGEPMISAGTPGWLCSSNVSSKSNDLFGLGMFAKWLDGREIDPFEDLDAYTTSPWTEDYVVPKIMAVGTSSGLHNNILTRAFCKHCSIVLSDSNVTYINLV